MRMHVGTTVVIRKTFLKIYNTICGLSFQSERGKHGQSIMRTDVYIVTALIVANWLPSKNNLNFTDLSARRNLS